MNSLMTISLVLNHPIKVELLFVIDENIKGSPLSNLFSIFFNRTLVVKNIWELENDHLLTKKVSEFEILYFLTPLGKELIDILKELVYWNENHA